MDKWKSTLISFAISLLFAIASYCMPGGVNGSLFWTIVVAVLTFLISYVFIGLWEHIKKIESADTNSEYKFFKECGISKYYNDFSSLDFATCISGATHIKIVLLYSNRFLKDYINVLQEFVARDGSSLEMIILTDDCDSSSFKYIAEKFSYSSDGLKEKLDDFVKILKNDIIPHKGQNSKIELYYTKFIPQYTLYMFGDYAYITLYKTAPKRTNLIPCFKVERAYDSSFFNFMLDDFNDIKNSNESRMVNL